MLAALGWLLRQRGWTLARVGFSPSLRSTVEGVGLAAIAYGVVIVVFFVAASFLGSTSRVEESTAVEALVAPQLSIPMILAVSILNPLFEELFVAGYLITVMKEARGFWPAVNASTGLRLLYHMYQGPQAVISILPLGLVFGYWYARSGSLWPLVVAHALFDAIALLILRGIAVA